MNSGQSIFAPQRTLSLGQTQDKVDDRLIPSFRPINVSRRLLITQYFFCARFFFNVSGCMSRQMEAIDLIFGLTVNLSNRRFAT